ncbi:MAG: hypothetical protein WC197_05115 [Candidatus Gastranaerophilaceae bacterium]|jgi:hypothetical protein
MGNLILQIFFNPQVKQTNNINNQKTKASHVSFCGINDSFEKTSNPQADFEKDAQLFAEKFSKTGMLSPALLEKLEKNDVNAIELDKLAKKYKKTLSLEDKKALLKHEEKILWQELDKPEIGVFRNLEDLISIDVKTPEFIPFIKLNALTGLNRTSQAYEALGMQFEDKAEKFEILQNVMKNTSDNSPYAFQIKDGSFETASFIAPDRKKLREFLNDVIKNEANDKIKNKAQKVLNKRKYDEIQLLKSLNDTQISIEQRKSAIEILGENFSEKLKEILPQMIKNKNTDNVLKTAAIWAAGRSQSKEAFELLYTIANDKNEKNLEYREMALHSIALYVKHNKDQVKQTFHNVIDEKSDLSELALILLEKVEGRFNQKDHELDRLGILKENKKRFEQARNKYIQTPGYKLNVQQTNWVDRALAPLNNAFEKITQKGSKAHIVEDTMTLIFPEEAGKRSFDENFEYGGEFSDSTTGVNLSTPGKPSTIIFSKNLLNSITKENVLAHEFNHNFLHDLLDKNDKKKLNELYEKAKTDKKCLDDYAALADYEYFAQGYEAYCTVYKPHSAMINNDDYIYGGGCHVRSTLKRKDPELYNFIEYCIKKYNGKSESSTKT